MGQCFQSSRKENGLLRPTFPKVSSLDYQGLEMLYNKKLLWSNVENTSLWNFKLHMRTLKALRITAVKEDHFA